MKIAEIARSYIGQKEVGKNAGFENEFFETEMRKAGWYDGAPWCMFFCRLVWNRSGINFKTTGASPKPFVVGSSSETSTLASKAKRWSAIPQVGSIAIWRNYKDGKQSGGGHGAIVIEVVVTGSKNGIPISGHFITVDGNVSNSVAQRKRSFSWTKNDGQRLIGFVTPE